MKRFVWIGFILAGIVSMVPHVAQAQADACAAVKREMAYGKAAAEDAKDKAGFALAAKEFNAAASKAPDCANAFRSLGIVQEGAGNLAAAKAAYERYLKLAPSSADVAAVEEQIFKLEYRIKQAAAAGRKASAQRQADESLARRLRGRWGKKKITLSSPTEFGRCRINVMMRGMLMDLRVSGTKVTGSVVGTPFLNTSSCKAYYARQNVPYIQATVKNGSLVGEKQSISFAGADTASIHGAPTKFEWKITMAPDGRSFTIVPKNDKYIKAGTDDARFLRW